MPARPIRARLAQALALCCLLATAGVALERAPSGDSLSAGVAEASRPRPNVVVVMTDDQAVRDMAVMPRTRALLARQGVRFRRSFVSYPQCCPSRATFLSGQYAHNHRVLGIYPPAGGYGRFDKENSLPVWLERAGYRTAHIGKYMNGYGSKTPANVPPGWSDWYGAVDPSTYRMWGYTLNENGMRRTYGRRYEASREHYQTDVYRDKAVALIRRRARSDAPFFLSVAFLAPHHEGPRVRRRTGRSLRPAPRHDGGLAFRSLPRPPSFDEADLSDKPAFIRRRPRIAGHRLAHVQRNYRTRLESLVAVDEAVAAIVRELERVGELDRTYVLFTSDNGFMYGEHRVPSGKLLPHDPSTRVPLLLRGPGVRAGRVSGELVANVDLAPTILDIAGARPGKRLDGRSLLPFARRPGRRTRRALLHETGEREFVTGRDLDADPLTEFRRMGAYKAVRTTRYLYVAWRSGERELYDMARDPHQLSSLHAAPRYAPVRAALHRVLRRLVRCRGRACSAPPSRPIPSSSRPIPRLPR